MSVQTIAQVLARNTNETSTEIVAASSALWKFAWTANKATENPMARAEFREKQADLGKYLMENYKPKILKATERKIGALGGKAGQIAKAIVQEDTRKLLTLVKAAKMSWDHLGVLAAIASFYKLQGD